MSVCSENLLLSTSPLLDIDGVEAVIVHLDRLDTKYFEHIDIQLPGHHILNRIGFREPGAMRDAIEYIDRHTDTIWTLAEENSLAYGD